MKHVIIAVVGLALGVTGGAYLAQSRLAPQLVDAVQERDALRKDLGRSEEEASLAQERARRLDADNAILAGQTEALRDQLAAARDPNEIIVICLSGRGDKDAAEIARLRESHI